MKKLTLFLLLALWLPLCVSAQDLAKILKDAGNASVYKDAPVVVLFDHTATRVRDNGLAITENEKFYKALNDTGLKTLKALLFNYDPLSAMIEIKAAKIVRQSGQIQAIDVARAADYPAPASKIYWGAREIALPVEDLSVNDGVYVKTLQKGFTYALLAGTDENRFIPPMKGQFYDIVPFYSDVPIKLKTYSLRLPQDKHVQFEFYNGEARHSVHFEGAETVYFWEKKEIQPVAAEDGMVSLSDSAPKLLVSTATNWQAKSQWFYKVNEDYGSFDCDADIKAKVDEILKGAKDDWDKIARLTHWVAEEIRYSGISMGTGEGYTLHKGSMTFRDRCGVCKDKAGMLISMLRAAGFAAYPAMTMAGSRIDRIPADQFNHCVTVVKVKGEYSLLDPTWVPGVRELWSSAEQQQEYLMGVPEGADLHSTPASNAQNHYIRYSIESKLDKSGALQGKLTISAEGQMDSGLRRMFRRQPIDTWPETLENYLRAIHPDIVLHAAQCSDAYNLAQNMTISCRFEIKDYFHDSGGEGVLQPLVQSLPFRNLLAVLDMNLALDTRQYAFRTRCSHTIELNETMQLPAGTALATTPALAPISGPAADFSGAIHLRNGALTIKQNLVLKKRIYPADEWANFKAAVSAFKRILDIPLILKKGGQI